MRSLFSRLLFSKPTSTYRQLSNKNGSFASNILASILPKFFRPGPASDPAKNDTSAMDIQRDRFGHEAIRLLQDIADSHFIAFDFEFSGIAERNKERTGKPTLQERYEETRLSVHEYQPLQIGLTIAKLDEREGRYVLEPYNFDLSPLPLLRERQFTRKWSMNSGAVSFLQRNGFDFGKQMLYGVPYLSLQEETVARTKMTADARRNDMVLKPDDQILVNHIRDSIAVWQSQPVSEREEFLNIPHNSPEGIPDSLNAYQRRLVHQIIQNEFPGMKSQGMGHFIQVTNPTSEQQATQSQLEEGLRERDLSRAIGFRWIIDGIIGRDLSKLPDDYLQPVVPALPKDSDAQDIELPMKAFVQDLNHKLQARRKVLIGHNCLTDIMFLYRMAVGDLPPTIEEFRDRVHDMFPAIIDTKFVSNCFSEKYGRLSLGEVASDLATDESLPALFLPNRFDRYAQTAFLHEAGYDSYITAKVAIQMATKLHMNGSARKKDHDRQQQEVEQAAAVASSLPEFGVQDGYTTAAETMDTASETSTSDTSKTLTGTIKSFFMPQTQTQPQSPTQRSVESNASAHAKTDSTNSITSNPSTPTNNNTNPSSVIAVKQTVADSPTSTTNRQPRPINWRDESAVAEVRSAFASTSIYDALGNDNDSMPGERTPVPDKDEGATEESEQAKMDRMVKEGKMMPRWHEEGAFWEIYGNRLQVNGTKEGVLKLVD